MKITFSEQAQKDMVRLFSNNLRYILPRRIKDIQCCIKYAYQRVTRGFDNPMIWNYHSEMTSMTIKILTIFKKNIHGYPSQLKDRKEWKQILTKIIKGFKAQQTIDNAEYMRPTKQVYKTGIFKGTPYLRIDKPMLARLEKRRDEGFKLYIKYYSNLWD